VSIRPILGESQIVKDMIKLIERVASTKTNILVIGESGTGKELVARMIHDAGPLKGKPFIPINCGAIPESLIESELFGHRKGSFTGAVNEKPGLFEAAHGGTLFLDEVGELPVSMQVKLLRAIQERVFRKVGGTDDIRVDVRIIAATNRDLEAGVKAGTFREDLYYRLNVILIRTPPLRERKGDIRLLADTFLKGFADKQKKKLMGLGPGTLAALENYPWPGNIRELENVMERAVTLESSPLLSVDALPISFAKNTALRATSAAEVIAASQTQTSTAGASILPPANFSRGPLDLDKVLGDVEKLYLIAALEHSGGVKKRAAECLNITFRSIRYRLKKLGIPSDPEDD